MKALLKKRVAIPGWLFVAVMVVLDEVLLHLWTMSGFQPDRFTAVAVFALGCGSLLSLTTSLFGGKAQKWFAVILTTLLAVLYLAEYFMIDAYKTFMPLSTMFARAGDVAGDYMDAVVSVLSQNVWRIALMLAPIVLYAIFAQPKKACWKARTILAVMTIGAYLLGFGIVKGVGTDADKLDKAYHFDGAIQSFGLHMGMVLDAVKAANGSEAQPEFIIPETVAAQPAETLEASQAETTAPTEPPVVYGDNAFDLDYAALAETETNPNIASLHSYVASQTPSKQNEYTGLFEGKNLILITAESFSAEVIDPERTPTLYRMATQGIQFTDYYQPVWNGSTTTGEFTNLIGLVPLWTGACMMELQDQNMFLTMGHQLQKLGYSSAAYHNGMYTYYNRNQTHTLLGYDSFTAMYNGLEEGVTIQTPQSDEELFAYTLPQHLGEQPFSLYYMTISGHAAYGEGHAMVVKNYSLVENLPYSSLVKGYLAANMELEFAMETTLEILEEAGIADDTVIVIATDHYPYGLEPSDTWGNYEDHLSELYGQEVTDCFIRDHSALVIWSGCLEDMEPIVIDTPTYSLDILPTLSNLFGVAYDSRLLVGRDVLSDEDPLVLWKTYSWKTEKGSFNADTQTFTPAEGVEVEEGYVDYMKSVVANKITFSKAIQEYNYYDAILKAMEAQSGEAAQPTE